jgi:23S rRNA (cytosine1962-C5)-methyltransferase
VKKVILRPRGVEKILSGRLWIDKEDVSQGHNLEDGELAKILTPQKLPLGIGYFNLKSRIYGRLLTTEVQDIDARFFRKRLQQALSFRKELYPQETSFRLVHGEGDFLPGLTIDWYNGVAVLQISTAGMERLKGLIIEALREILPLKGLVLRNDLPVRQEEGLALYVENQGVKEPVEIRIHGLRFLVDPVKGQKTGFFLDQRENREKLARHVEGKTVFDLFCYTGAFSLVAAAAGARRVIAVDRSQTALDWLKENARLNGLEAYVIPVALEVETFLRQTQSAQVVILDPPAFIKKKKDFHAGRKRYLKLNRLALERLDKGGLIFTSSCSQFLSLRDLEKVVQEAASGRFLRLLEIGLQAPDHPPLHTMPETLYLKGLFLKSF